jgi:NitT/TauT family transport system substrate-binding protein
MPTTYTRRRLLKALSAAAVGITGTPHVLTAAEALETTTVRIVNDGSICIAPLLAAEELLRAEGFTDVLYPKIAAGAQVDEGLARGAADFSVFAPFEHMLALDAGAPVTVLAGVHVGCFELFARQGIDKVTDLKGKTVGLHATPLSLLTLMAAQVGLDPAKDIEWVTTADANVKPLDLFADGKIDAFLGFPPEPQELRARHAGHVLLNTATDRPWSQYFCCMLASNRGYVRKHPIATKRVLRAILKAADLCVTEPSHVARQIVDGGFTARYDYALETLSDVPYDKWREYDPEDSMRFYALRLREAGLIKSTPQKIIADHTDWRFLNELKRELKA